MVVRTSRREEQGGRGTTGDDDDEDEGSTENTRQQSSRGPAPLPPLDGTPPLEGGDPTGERGGRLWKPRRERRSWVKGEEVSSRSAGLVGKRALGGEQEHRA